VSTIKYEYSVHDILNKHSVQDKIFLDLLVWCNL